MFHYICKTLIQIRIVDSKFSNVLYLQTLPSLRFLSISVEEQSLTVSYLTNTCGLTLENALSISKTVKITDIEKADSVINLLTSHGFTKTHIAPLVLKHPHLLLAHAERTLKPKIEFYESLGIVGSNLQNMISSSRQILMSSLKHRIVHNIEFLKDYIGSNEKLIVALKQQSTRIIGHNLPKIMTPNINTLLAHGVPKANICRLITSCPQSLMWKNDLFEKVVNKLVEMDIDPSTRTFTLAVRCSAAISVMKWEKKKELYLSFGWSEETFVSAFKLQPMIIQTSLKKIAALMEFMVQQMGMDPLSVACYPNLLLLSLERRIAPRWSVLHVLMTKDLISKNIKVLSKLNSSKVHFEKMFVTPHKDVPEVINAYQVI